MKSLLGVSLLSLVAGSAVDVDEMVAKKGLDFLEDFPRQVEYVLDDFFIGNADLERTSTRFDKISKYFDTITPELKSAYRTTFKNTNIESVPRQVEDVQDELLRLAETMKPLWLKMRTLLNRAVNMNDDEFNAEKGKLKPKIAALKEEIGSTTRVTDKIPTIMSKLLSMLGQYVDYTGSKRISISADRKIRMEFPLIPQTFLQPEDEDPATTPATPTKNSASTPVGNANSNSTPITPKSNLMRNALIVTIVIVLLVLSVYFLKF